MSLTIEEALIVYELQFGCIDLSSINWLPGEYEFLQHLALAVYPNTILQYAAVRMHSELCNQKRCEIFAYDTR